MPSITGKYQHYKNENIEDYFTAVGVPYMGRKMMSMSSPVMEITLEGETMTIKNSSLLRTTEYKFKLGEEYVENMPNTSIKSVTILVNDHEIQTNSVIPENNAKCGRHYLFTDDECIISPAIVSTYPKSAKICDELMTVRLHMTTLNPGRGILKDLIEHYEKNDGY